MFLTAPNRPLGARYQVSNLNAVNPGPSRRYMKARGLVPEAPPRPARIPKAVRRSLAYILSRFEPELNSGCWLWTGGTDRYGYGTQWIDGRVVYAHRLSYQHHHGPIPDGFVVRHKCDTPACINPDHLLTGTPMDNVMDMFARGRSRWHRQSTPNRP